MIVTAIQETLGVIVAIATVFGVVYCLTHLWHCWLNPTPKPQHHDTRPGV